MTRHAARTRRADRHADTDRCDRTPLVAPLDPDSDKGREVAARLSEVFEQIREEIAADAARGAAENKRTASP